MISFRVRVGQGVPQVSSPPLPNTDPKVCGKPANASARALFLCDAGYRAAKAVCQQCQYDVQCDLFGVARVRGSWRAAGRPVQR